MAGDSCVHKAINVIIELTAQQDFVGSIDLEEIRDKLRTPICILPFGSTNMIAKAIYGTSDFHTPLMHLFYCEKMRIDISAVFKNANKLHSFGFGYSSGFGATLARYMRRYDHMGLNKFKTSLAKGISKNRHR